MEQMIYRYDGSLNGFLCCVYRAVRLREQPMMILEKEELQSLLFAETRVPTEPDKARRVCDAIGAKIGDEAMDFVRRALLTALPGREIYLLAFLRRAFREGPRVLDDLADPTVNKLRKAVYHLDHEAHLYCGFVRFQQSGGVLSAVIEPKNRVLTLMMDHFTNRFSGEAFLIYDKTHREALLYAKGQARVIPIEDFAQPAADQRERAFQELWRGFFRAVAIEPRSNPLCQRTLMPKRYWGQMTEMRPTGGGPGNPPAGVLLGGGGGGA